MEYISCSHGGSKLQTTWHRDIICLQSIIHSLSHPWVIIGFVRRVTWRVPLVEQEVLTFTEHLSSPLLCNEVCVAQSLVFCGVFCRSLLFLSFYNICSLPSYCLSLFDLWLLVTTLLSSNFSQFFNQLTKYKFMTWITMNFITNIHQKIPDFLIN